MSRQLEVERLDLLQSNVFLVRSGTSQMLVDTGGPQTLKRLRKLLAARGVGRGDLSAIVITHAHPDHAGAARDLRDEFGAPVLVHGAEADWLRDGRTELYEPCGIFGRILDKTIDREFPGFDPDETLSDGDRLGAYGFDAHIVHTPGHTPGSICVVGDNGQAIVGDLLGGGVLRRDRPRGPFFVQARAQLNDSVQALLEHQPATWHFGHGKPASSQSVRARWRGL